MSDSFARVNGPVLQQDQQYTFIAEIPKVGANDCPERRALFFAEAGRETSYAKLEAQTNAFARYLQSQGLQAGQRIAYLGMNNDDFFSVLFGAIRSSVVLVPLNWRLTAPEIAYQLQDSESVLLIHDAALDTLANQACESLPHMQYLTVEDLRGILEKEGGSVAVPRDPAEVILQMYTSGTTGKPKGTLITHGGLSIARQAELESREMAHYRTGASSLSAMPNFHIGGMSWVIMGLIRKGSVVISADPSPGNMLDLLRQHEAKHSFIVPTVLRAVVADIEENGGDVPRMDGIYYGAMPIGESLLEKIREVFNCPLLQFFGMTENTGSATFLGPEDHDPARPKLLKSVGKPYPGMSLEIRDPQGHVVAPGVNGEIWIQSPTLMAGYWKLPEATEKAVVDGWYASGDGGYLDEEGYLFLTDRIKDMIVSGGENVYPAEVEEALRQCDGVLDAAVIGFKDDKWGERVVALVELKPEAQLGSDDLMAQCRTRLASYKCPKEIKFGSLPRTASGKVQRAEVRARYADL